MSGAPKFAWNRPLTVAYPQIWSVFVARGVDTDDMIEYRIQDLPVERFEDAMQYMLNNYLKEDPIIQTLGGSNCPDVASDYARIWRAALAQNTVLTCLSGSGEFVGLDFNYVITKDDTFFEEMRNLCKSPITRDALDAVALLYRDFDVFGRYGVQSYLSSIGTTVNKKYRDRGITRQLLLARKQFCRSMNIPLTHNVFPSEPSNRVADRSGFKPDVTLTYKEITQLDPKLKFAEFDSGIIGCKTRVF